MNVFLWTSRKIVKIWASQAWKHFQKLVHQIRKKRKNKTALTLWSISPESIVADLKTWHIISRVSQDTTQDLQFLNSQTNFYPSKARISFSEAELLSEPLLQTLPQKLSRNYYLKFCTLWNLSGIIYSLVRSQIKPILAKNNPIKLCTELCWMKYIKTSSRIWSNKTLLPRSQ